MSKIRSKCVLFVDGENFIHKIEDVLHINGVSNKNAAFQIDYASLIKGSIPDTNIDTLIFYTAKLRLHPDTPLASKKLIERQRMLKSKLEKSGFKVVIAGNVRGQKVSIGQEEKTIFKEKGVDVRIAVDMVSMTCDKLISRAILCSSDSDLQPAVSECRRRKIEVYYLGFEHIPNKGLIATTNRSILIRTSDILNASRTL